MLARRKKGLLWNCKNEEGSRDDYPQEGLVQHMPSDTIDHHEPSYTSNDKTGSDKNIFWEAVEMSILIIAAAAVFIGFACAGPTERK